MVDRRANSYCAHSAMKLGPSVDKCEHGNRPCPPRPSLKIVDEGPRFEPRNRRRSDTKYITLSPSERLCSAFVNVLKIENPAYSLLTLGEFTRYVPLFVGHGKAVDSVVASLLSSHDRLLRGGDPSSRIDPGLYTRALCNMQRELNDPDRWRSTRYSMCCSLTA